VAALLWAFHGSSAQAQTRTPAYLVNVPALTVATTGVPVCAQNIGLQNGVIIYGVHVSGNNAVLNSNAVWLGGPGVQIGQGLAILPQDKASVAINTTNGICINGTAGDGVTIGGGN
jgi:hypothetical protein